MVSVQKTDSCENTELQFIFHNFGYVQLLTYI